MGHCRARDVGRHRPLRSQRSWPLLRCFTVSLLHRFTWALATIISHAPPSCPSCSDERHELLLEESLEEHEALKMDEKKTSSPNLRLSMPGCTSWMGTCPSAKSRTMRSRFVNGAWWKKSSTTDTDDFPFLRQATAARRGIPRKRCRPTPPCLTRLPSCLLPFSPGRGRARSAPAA